MLLLFFSRGKKAISYKNLIKIEQTYDFTDRGLQRRWKSKVRVINFSDCIKIGFDVHICYFSKLSSYEYTHRLNIGRKVLN